MIKERKIILGEFKEAEEQLADAVNENLEAKTELDELIYDSQTAIDDALSLAKGVHNLPDKYSRQIQEIQNSKMRFVEKLIADEKSEDEPETKEAGSGRRISSGLKFAFGRFASKKRMTVEELKALSADIHEFASKEGAIKEETAGYRRNISDLRASYDSLTRSVARSQSLKGAVYGAFNSGLKTKLKDVLGAAGQLCEKLSRL